MKPSSWGQIDWATTAAVVAAIGAWASAIATSTAVYIAARLSERNLRLGAARERLRRLELLSALIEHAQSLGANLSRALKEQSGPPKSDEFADVLAALDSISALDIPGDRGVVWRLFMVKRSLGSLMSALPASGAFKSTSQTLVECALAEAVFSTALSEIAIVARNIDIRCKMGLW